MQPSEVSPSCSGLHRSPAQALRYRKLLNLYGEKSSGAFVFEKKVQTQEEDLWL